MSNPLAEALNVVRESCEAILAKGVRQSYSEYLFPIFALREDDFATFIRDCNTISHSDDNGSARSGVIPKIIHHVWITADADGFMPHPPYIEEICSQAKENDDYLHYLWCNSKRVSERLDETFRAAGARVSVMSVRKYFETDPLLYIVNKFVEEKKYVGASDILRMLVLREYGGLYIDMGVSISRDICELLEAFSAMINVDSQKLFQLCALAFPPHHPLIELWCKVCLDPNAMCALIHPAGRGVSGIEELSYLSGPGFTAAVLLLLSPREPTLVIPQQFRYMQVSSQKSWYGDVGKFGNEIVAGTAPTLLCSARHAEIRERLEPRLALARTEGATGMRALLQSLYA